MSNFSRRKQLDVPDGDYRVIAAIQGLPERTYALRVKDGLPSLFFPSSIPNSLSPYHLLELQSESILPVLSGDGNPLFRVTVVLPNPHPFLGMDGPKWANFEALYIALNAADTDQVALKRGKHLLFASKGRVKWSAALNFLMDYFFLVIGKKWLEAQTE